MSRRDRTARAGPAVLWFGGGPAALFACVAAGLFSFGALLAASLFGRIWKPVPTVAVAEGQRKRSGRAAGRAH